MKLRGAGVLLLLVLTLTPMGGLLQVAGQTRDESAGRPQELCDCQSGTSDLPHRQRPHTVLLRTRPRSDGRREAWPVDKGQLVLEACFHPRSPAAGGDKIRWTNGTTDTVMVITFNKEAERWPFVEDSSAIELAPRGTSNYFTLSKVTMRNVVNGYHHYFIKIQGRRSLAPSEVANPQGPAVLSDD